MVQADRFTLFEILQMLAVKDAHKEDDLGVDDFIWVNVRETSCRNPRFLGVQSKVSPDIMECCHWMGCVS